MKNEKKVMLLSLTILAVLLTGFTWAYWNSGKIEAANVKAESNTIKIGSGSTEIVKTKLSLGKDKNLNDEPLIPADITKDISKSQVSVKFNLEWATEETDTDYKKLVEGARGKVIVKNIALNTDRNDSSKTDENDEFMRDILNSLFNIELDVEGGTELKKLNNGNYEYEAPLNASTIMDFTVTFSKSPDDKLIYDKIQGQELVLNFEVQVEPYN